MIATEIPVQPRYAVCGTTPEILADIFDPKNNLAVWQRLLPQSCTDAIENLLNDGKRLNITQEVPASGCLDVLNHIVQLTDWPDALKQDIAHIVDMYTCLFGVDSAGLRLRTLDGAMCPKFHFDRVPCRLITTYHGTGTQWLPQTGNKYQNSMQTLNSGDIALLKGATWPDNADGAIIHRSPPVMPGEKRLLLTLDAI
ncbi:DUF1826 domain-containing protein [Salinimonas lutimaris]|uniref:DUF1826 domain-containing protein n=1 Tax=Salinimonas lutimaris TaxID=914153 RepID=UPI0010C0615C|nr:DUF1826 domain-containing protein [Salinimonas lutimaris]